MWPLCRGCWAGGQGKEAGEQSGAAAASRWQAWGPKPGDNHTSGGKRTERFYQREIFTSCNLEYFFQVFLCFYQKENIKTQSELDSALFFCHLLHCGSSLWYHFPTPLFLMFSNKTQSIEHSWSGEASSRGWTLGHFWFSWFYMMLHSHVYSTVFVTLLTVRCDFRGLWTLELHVTHYLKKMHC